MTRKKKALTLDKLPYGGTDVPVGTSKEQIQAMLVKAGADGIIWSDAYKPRRKAILQFVKNEKLYRITVPIHTDDLEAQRYHISGFDWDRYIIRREAAMFRAIFHYLDGLLKAEQHGLITFEEAFIGHAMVHLSNGREATVAEAILEMKLEPGRALPAPDAEDKNRAFAEARRV